MNHLRSIAVAGFLAATVFPAAAVEISGAGATFPYPVYAKWADTYKKETGVGLNYQSIGSGGGIKQIQNKTVTFGASDMPLQPAGIEEDGTWSSSPRWLAVIVPVVNLEGIKANELKLDGRHLGENLPWRDDQLGRSGDQEAQPERQAALAGNRRRSPVGRLGHDLYLDGLSVEGQRRSGSPMSARLRRLNGPQASGPKATKAFPIT